MFRKHWVILTASFCRRETGTLKIGRLVWDHTAPRDDKAGTQTESCGLVTLLPILPQPVALWLETQECPKPTYNKKYSSRHNTHRHRHQSCIIYTPALTHTYRQGLHFTNCAFLAQQPSLLAPSTLKRSCFFPSNVPSDQCNRVSHSYIVYEQLQNTLC